MTHTNEVGSTLDFVIGRGFAQAGNYTALLGFDGTRRVLAELFADADRAEVRPPQAFFNIFHSLQPGWTVRLLQIFWPDAEPREAFLRRQASWDNHAAEGLDILHQGLSLAVQQYPLPFLRRTFVEFVLPGNEGLAWWEGLPGVCAASGVQVRYLDDRAIQELTYRILNPSLEAERYAVQGGNYRQSVAPSALELADDHLLFPETVLLPISARGGGTPGMSDRPWSRTGVDLFVAEAPVIYSLTVHCEPPDSMRSGLRARRTLSEGVLSALAMKTGRRPSMAESVQDTAMDAAESELALGKPIFRVLLLACICADRRQLEEAVNYRRNIESSLRAKGLLPQKLHYIPAQALLHLQPGGNLFPGFIDAPKLFYEEFQKLIPRLSRRVMPVKDAVWIGVHGRDRRDVHFSFTAGLDPTTPPPAHALTLILGKPGAGKTTLLRWIMLQRLMQGRTTLSIDPEGENNKLCEAMGGKVVPAGIPDDPATCLLHPLQADTPQDMLLAARFLVAALVGEEALTPGIQATLHEAVKRRWERNPGDMSIADLVDALGTLNDPNAGAPMALLRPYMYGGLWEGFFDRPKALLDIKLAPGQWLNFDISVLQDANKGIIHAVLAWFLYHVVTMEKTPMDIYIDEGWRLLRSGPFADLLDELGRRARKRDIGVTLITHMPQDLAKNPTSLSMASTAFIGRIGVEEAYAFFRSIGVAESEARQNAEAVAQLPDRTFMAAPDGGRGALFPILVTIPPAWLEFWERLGIIQKRLLE
jgi:hypothetical protein